MKMFRMTACFMFVLTSTTLFAQPVQQNLSPDEIKAIEMQKRLESVAQLQKRGLLKTDTISPLTSLQSTVKGTFWRNPEWIKLLDLSTDQQKKMDEIFQQYRLKLIDLTASLQKEELILEPLLVPNQPAPEAEGKILTQIDRIADARAELEKANSRMLVSILHVLNADQRNKLPMPAKKTIFAKPN
jgi:Spy/CpxP family protein refolding chaperone